MGDANDRQIELAAAKYVLSSVDEKIKKLRHKVVLKAPTEEFKIVRTRKTKAPLARKFFLMLLRRKAKRTIAES